MTDIDSRSFITPHPSGRFNVTYAPQFPPNACVVCGSPGGDGREFIDFAFTIDFYGAVYFCSICMGEGCNRLGYINHAQWIQLQKEIEEKNLYIQKLEADNVNLRSGLASLSSVFSGSSSPMDSGESGAGTQSNEFHSTYSEHGTSENDKRFDESSSGKGFNGIQDSDVSGDDGEIDDFSF